MVMGRPNKGVEHAADLDAGDREKQRLRAILRTITGEQSVLAASAELGIQPARFGEIRRRMLQAAVESLAPGRPGRPPLVASEEQARLRVLEAENARLQRELELARMQVQLAREIPGLPKPRAKRGVNATVENNARRRGR
jgi:hypothetical protein